LAGWGILLPRCDPHLKVGATDLTAAFGGLRSISRRTRDSTPFDHTVLGAEPVLSERAARAEGRRRPVLPGPTPATRAVPPSLFTTRSPPQSGRLC